MRKGFTMIELIFVIVILGILAAVAIPRLAATRDDAEISKAASNLATLLTDLSSYYTSQGGFTEIVKDTTPGAQPDATKKKIAKWKDITNVVLYTTKDGKELAIDQAIAADDGTATPVFLNLKGKSCVQISASDSKVNAPGGVTFTAQNDTDAVCKAFQEVASVKDMLGKKHEFGGSKIKF